jgi:transposase
MTTTINLALHVCLIIHSGEILPVQKERNILFLLSNIPSDDVWNEVKHILPKEKPRNTKVHPAAVPFRNVLGGILFVLRTGCHWKKMLPKEYGSDSTCHLRFQQWVRMDVFQKLWVRLLKFTMTFRVSNGNGNLLIIVFLSRHH